MKGTKILDTLVTSIVVCVPTMVWYTKTVKLIDAERKEVTCPLEQPHNGSKLETDYQYFLTVLPDSL
ncbi:hypothetical protein Q1695_001946 [Nippostrongylus brasiliensis]|nr:hypothetical protein Q1695_001946 [Nippostrongylus brasiliensis]